jgi:hypothetical protein
MNDDKKLVKIQEDDLIIFELDARCDMGIVDPLGIITQPTIPPGNTGGNVNCIAC